MWFAGILSFFFGMLQVFLLQKSLSRILGGDFMQGTLFFLIKLTLYAAGALTLVFLFQAYVPGCAAGYLLGLPVTATAYFAYKTFSGKNSNGGDGKNENADDH